MKTRIALLAPLLLALLSVPLIAAPWPATDEPPTASQETNDTWANGSWKGTLEIPGGSLVFHIHLDAQDGSWSGTVDVPQQGAQGVALPSVQVEGDQLRFTLPGMGEPRFEGSLQEGEIVGTFHQGGASLPLTFQRPDPAAPAPAAPVRPQTPEPPFPYRSQDLVYGHDTSNGPVTLAATLTLPDEETHGKGPYPAILLLSGSGQQDRDETLFGHKPFLVLADHFARAGIAVLRVDDRGVGESEGPLDNATILDFADDAALSLHALMSRLEIDTSRIGILGHSEGGLIAPLAAQRFHEKYGVSVAFYVFFGAPGVPGDDLIVRQVERLNLAAGLPPQVASQNAALQRQIFDLMESEADEAVLRQKLIDKLTPFIGAEAAAAQIQPLLTPWYRHFIAYDPAPALRQVKSPVLAVNGNLDSQVDAEQNLTAIQAALEAAGNDDATILTVAGINHLMQPAKTGSAQEYAEIETTIAPQVLDTVTAWILERVGPAKEAGDASAEDASAEDG